MKTRIILTTLLVLTTLLSVAQENVYAAPLTQSTGRTAVIGQLLDLPSDVLVRPSPTAVEVPAFVGQVIAVGGTVRTLGRGNARIDLSDGTIIRITPKSMFTLTELNPSTATPITQLKLFFGNVWVILNGGNLSVETPVGVASVRGSYMGVYYNSDIGLLKIGCLETTATCQLTIGGVTYTILQGQKATMPPLPPVGPKIEEMTAIDYKDWTLLVPEAQVVIPNWAFNIVFSGILPKK